MKMGILGTGMIVQDFLQTATELDIDELSIYGRKESREKTETLAAQYGIARCFYDYEELLASDVDTIYVALPNSLHYSFTKKALEADRNVILEKPATACVEELEELKTLADRRDRILIEAVTTHYLPAYRQIKEDIKKLGDIKIVNVNYSQYSSRYDRFKAGEVPPVFDPEKAGGALMDLNVYNLHFMAGLFGGPESASYYANMERGIDTSGIMMLDYGTFKAVCIGAKDCQAPILSSIQGDKGSILVHAPVNQMQAYDLAINGEAVEHKSFEEGKHRMAYEFREFIRMIREHDKEKADEMMEISLQVARMIRDGKAMGIGGQNQ